MKNLKLKIKIILTMLVLALGFSFCINLVSVNAEETVETETTEQVNVVGIYEYNLEEAGNAKFTLYSDYTFTAEVYDAKNDETIEGTGTYILDGNILIINTDNGVLKCKVNGNKLEPYEESEETKTVDPNSFLSHLKDFKWEDAEAVITFIASYFGVDLILKIILSVIIVLFKLKKEEQLKVSKEALVMSEIEHQQKVEKLETDYTNAITEIKNEVKEFIASQTEKIVALSNDKTKAIAEEVKQVTELLK